MTSVPACTRCVVRPATTPSSNCWCKRGSGRAAGEPNIEHQCAARLALRTHAHYHAHMRSRHTRSTARRRSAPCGYRGRSAAAPAVCRLWPSNTKATDVRVRSPAAIVPAHRSTWGVVRGVLMASLQVCRSPCLIQTARPRHDRVLTQWRVCSQVALATRCRAAARVRHPVRSRCAAAPQLRAEHGERLRAAARVRARGAQQLPPTPTVPTTSDTATATASACTAL